MPRNKKAAALAEPAHTATEAHPNTVTPRMQRPAYIDGAPVDEQGRVIQSALTSDDGQMPLEAQEPTAKNWGPAYKAIVTTPTFEMGENRRYKQRVFKFMDKPEPEVLAKLKEAGFSFRMEDKTWTIHADHATRVLSDELAAEFAGASKDLRR